MERDKVNRLSQEKVDDVAKAILVDMEAEFRSGNFSRLTNAHLDTLLKWHNVQKDKNNKKKFKLICWCRIWEEKVDSPQAVDIGG